MEAAGGDERERGEWIGFYRKAVKSRQKGTGESNIARSKLKCSTRHCDSLVQ